LGALRLAGALLAFFLAFPAARADEAAAGETGAGPPPEAAVAPPAAPDVQGSVTAEPPRTELPPEGAALGEEIVVTATRGARARRDTAAAVTVVPRGEIERSPSKTADELLRAVPSFGLFRRASSVAADPTSQGVNLRGIGPSGVSRSLVLVDGIPANDPFGGWIYWRAIPRAGLEQIEVVPGGGSALYGNYALGGVTQFLSRPITGLAGVATADYGAMDTYQVGVRAADRRGPVGAMLEAEMFDSSGYRVVAPAARGAIDGNTPSKHSTVNARIEAAAAPDLSFTLRAGYFSEEQNGGTRYTTADVRRFEWAAGARYSPGELGAFDLTVFGHANEFEQTRTRVLSGRASEEQAAAQDVPAHDVGASALWTSRPMALAGAHILTIGTDVRRITGETREDLFPPSSSTPAATTVVRRDAGGEQRLYGAFGQDQYDVSRAVALNLAVRYDRWENTDASRFERTFDGSTNPLAFAARSDDLVSPKVGLRVKPADGVILRAEAYRSFRAPTLNELYRPFQVGPVRTEANENLEAETLTGGEAGLELAPAHALTARLTGFWNVMEDPITNVTCATLEACPDLPRGVIPGPNVRQRQNLGQARIRGVEASAGWRFARAWVASLAYTYAHSRVTEAPGQPQLLGKDLLQDPRHRATASLAFDDPRLASALVQVRYVGSQYEDDLNTLPMSDFYLVDLSVSRRVTANLEAVLAVENLFDKQYLVGRPGGLDNVGQPRFVHGGVRARFGG